MLKANRKYIETLTESLAKKEGITFKEGSGWSVNVQDKCLTYDLNTFQDLDYLKARGLILHETGHIKFTEMVEPSELAKKNPALQDVYNAIEDLRVEKNMVDGYGDFASEGLASIYKLIFPNNTQALKEGEIDTLREILLGIISFYNCQETNYSKFFSLNEITRDYWQLISQNAREKIDKIYNEAQVAVEIKNLPNFEGLRDFIDEKIYPILKEEIESQNNKPPNPENTAQKIIGEKRGRGLCKDEGKGENEIIPQEDELNSLLNPYISTLASKLKSILAEKKAIKYSGNYLKGKLLSKNAYKVLTGEDRIFSKRRNPDSPDYEITFVLDASGSMSNDGKQVQAFIGTFLLSETMRRLGFNSRLIRYSDKVKTIDSLEGYREEASGGNRDEEALEYVLSKMNKDKDNIIFLLTDGGACQDPRKIVAKIKEEKITFVPVGIGLDRQDKDYFDNYYPENQVIVKNPEDLPKTLVQVLSKIIHR